jgi:DMSO/TMAO reductase YedYZ molybdopterin-dependent catalytic subunit
MAATAHRPGTTGSRPPGPERWALAVGGALAAGAALATSVLLDGLSTRFPPLIASVGQGVIRLAPGAAARQAVDALGTTNKPALLTGTVVVCMAIGAMVGMASWRRLRVAIAAYGGFALLGTAAAVELARTGVVESAATAGASASAGLALHAWVHRALDADRPSRWARPALDAGGAHLPIGRAVTRRRFLTVASVGAAGTAAAVGTGRVLQQQAGVEAARAGVVLPPAGDAVGPPPPGAALPAEGISALVTPNEDFFRIDEALVVPRVDLDSWRLEVTGMVERPMSLTFDDLLARDLVERHITIACVSNEVGGDLIGNALWLGVRLADLLEEAGVAPGADQVVGRSVDRFTVGFPTELALDGRDALVAVGMNGEPLPRRHGFPARLVVPGLFGYVSATKWLREIELATFAAFDPYWVQRGWSAEGPVLTQSRIDVPRRGARLRPGPTTIAGVAWAMPSGVRAVDVSVDGGAWRPATLAAAISDDTWRQWALEWDATPGPHRLAVRATDETGFVQDDTARPVFPRGATGHHHVAVEVG